MKTLLFLFLSASVCFARDYPATVIGVHDGDTITCIFNLGMNVTLKETIRINGIDAPELPTAKGKISQVALRDLLLGKEIIVSTNNDKREKYGRILAKVLIGDIDVAEYMIKKGLAKEYHGGKRTPAPDDKPADEVPGP